MDECPVGPCLARHRAEPCVGDGIRPGQHGEHGKLLRAVGLHDLPRVGRARMLIVDGEALHRPSRRLRRRLRPEELKGHVRERLLGIGVRNLRVRHRGRDRHRIWRSAGHVEERWIRGVRHSRNQPVEHRQATGRKHCRGNYARRIEPPEHVVERSIFEHHRDDVLDLGEDWHVSALSDRTARDRTPESTLVLLGPHRARSKQARQESDDGREHGEDRVPTS